MNATKRTNQTGSVLLFIIVATVLGLALVGTVAFVRYKGQEAQSQTPIFGTNTPATDSPAPRDNGANDQSEADKKAEDTKKQEADRQAATEANRRLAESSSPQSKDDSSALPHTGPTDLVASFLIISLVTMVAVSYIRSRRLGWQL